MMHRKIEWGKEIAETGSQIAGLAQDVGVPGIGVLAKFANNFYDKHLQKRFEKFITDSDVDEVFLEKILHNESHSNCFYAILESVRQTHSKIGVIALALIYKEHWDEPDYLIQAIRSFSQVSDRTINAFIVLYESLSEDMPYLTLTVQKEDGACFHELYNEAVELIARNFFVLSASAAVHANGPVQGMKWNHTETYYLYCKRAQSMA